MNLLSKLTLFITVSAMVGSSFAMDSVPGDLAFFRSLQQPVEATVTKAVDVTVHAVEATVNATVEVAEKTSEAVIQASSSYPVAALAVFGAAVFAGWWWGSKGIQAFKNKEVYVEPVKVKQPVQRLVGLKKAQALGVAKQKALEIAKAKAQAARKNK